LSELVVGDGPADDVIGMTFANGCDNISFCAPAFRLTRPADNCTPPRHDSPPNSELGEMLAT
jgi:hypothetical protein